MHEPLITTIETLVLHSMSEVFQQMLKLEIDTYTPGELDPDPHGEIVGGIGLVGKVAGVIYLHTPVSVARVITSRLSGLRLEEVTTDEVLQDAMRELCNMLGGQVKSRLSDRGWSCNLKGPTIRSGSRLTVSPIPDTTQKLIGFRCCEHSFHVGLMFRSD